MAPYYVYVIAFMISITATVVTMPIVKFLAEKFDVVAQPSERKVHVKPIPEMGGLAILFGFMAGFLYLWPTFEDMIPVLIGGVLITIVGILDDKYSLSPKYKLIGQLIAALIPVSTGVTIDFINLPVIGYVEFGWLSYPFTVFWIIAIVNAINLIDGLDGLASGVSSIATTAMLVMAIVNYQSLAISLSTLLLAGLLGFLFFNSHPAKIFMGDTGALFIGYMIAMVSVNSLFKSLTFFSLIIPIIVLGVPIFDTLFAIIRRLLKKQKLSAADKSHLHHCLLSLGFSHRTTVHIIYTISLVFAVAAIVLSKSLLWGTLFILCLLLVMLEFTVEIIGVLNNRKTPLINTVRKIVVFSQALKK